ncbi:uncharacterized protein RHO25_003498 [Cercospora beticola]|uniref:F-box domain-containing protein n=1 Tax=Cercospora beticola TaxID=122368 RepID=A0ABZ0NHA0_CERBT|nr:hypothetical protein RHO25_003498 [Cercospora beticola]CAK1360179.1 unnamed protein product [Cercospora beticola]
MSTGKKRDIANLQSSADEGDEIESGRSSKKHCAQISTDEDPSSAIVAFTESNMNIFSFFALPRELRDMIYDEMKEKRTTEFDTKTALRASTYALVPRNTAISRQFYDEAMDRVEELPELRLTDTHAFLFDDPIQIPESLHATTVTLQLGVKELPFDLTGHEQWVRLWLARMFKLEVLRIRINVCSLCAAMLIHMIERSNFWLHLKGLHELKVFCAYGDLFDFAEESDSKLVAMWARESGELERVDLSTQGSS